MAKIRVYELARELDQDNKTLEKTIRGLGFDIKNYMSTLTQEQAQVVRQKVGKPGAAAAAAAPAKKPESSSKPKRAVRRRRAAGPRPAEKLESEGETDEKRAPSTTAAPATRPVRRPVDAPRRREVVVRRAEPSPGQGAAQDSADRPRRGEHQSGQPERQQSQAPTQRSEAPSDSQESIPSPAVGTRIELPKNTRRLPGGLADRMERTPTSSEARSTPSESHEESRSASAAPESEARKQSAEAGGEAAADKTSETSSDGGRAVEVDDGRNVIRNEDGVIVGVKTKQQGPNIVDFIQLEPRRPRQQVIIEEAKQGPGGGRATRRKQREERAQSISRRRKSQPRGRRGERRPPPESTTQEMSEAKKRIRVDEAIQVSDLAHQMGVKVGKIVRALWGMGLRGITVNNAVDFETASLVAAEFGYTAENVSFQEDEFVSEIEVGEGDPRPPVVTVMGHVDHGKTSLLAYIRSADVAGGEAGGITQHIGAYKVKTSQGEIVFLDTPGHQAFSAMRSRGAHLTDIVILIVAADDGVMPTTIEAIKHANEAKTPIIVAVNKMDKPEANPGRVKQMLMEHGLVGEEFGGDTPIALVSAKTGKGIEDLLELVSVQAELMDLRASSEGRAAGTVIEARVDKGRGPVSTLLVQSGTLSRGDVLVADECSGKVRTIFSDKGEELKQALPGTPVEVLGLDGAPSAGDRFSAVENEKAAKQVVGHRRDARRRKESVKSGPSVLDMLKKKSQPTLKIVLRADVQGSAEAVKETLEELSTAKVKVEVIFTGVGAINETDVKLANAGDAVIVGFNVKAVGKAAQVADAEKVRVFNFSVIYEATEKVTELMIDMLEPEYREREQGEAEVRALFPIPRLGTVAGCRIIKGSVTRNSHIRVRRDDEIIFDGKVGSLRVHKDDVKEVKEGFECGIVVQDFPDVREGDILESYELETLRPTLE